MGPLLGRVASNGSKIFKKGDHLPNELEDWGLWLEESNRNSKQGCSYYLSRGSSFSAIFFMQEKKGRK